MTQDGPYGPKDQQVERQGDEIEHVCAKIRKPDEGHLQCNSEHIQVKEIPDQPQELKFREQKIAKLVDQVMSGNRLIELIGLPGIGKSSVARCSIHYMMQRKYFTGGIILINLKNDHTFAVLERKLKMVLIDKLKLRHSAKRDEIETAKFEEFVQILKDFFA